MTRIRQELCVWERCVKERCALGQCVFSVKMFPKVEAQLGATVLQTWVYILPVSRFYWSETRVSKLWNKYINNQFPTCRALSATCRCYLPCTSSGRQYFLKSDIIPKELPVLTDLYISKRQEDAPMPVKVSLMSYSVLFGMSGECARVHVEAKQFVLHRFSTTNAHFQFFW